MSQPDYDPLLNPFGVSVECPHCKIQIQTFQGGDPLKKHFEHCDKLPPVEHEGATEEWSPMADIKPIQGPELQPDEWAGFWSIVYGLEVFEAPSLVEVVAILSTLRSKMAEANDGKPITLYWRAP